MNKIFEIVNRLEDKLSRLLSQHTILQQENIKLLQNQNNLQQQLVKKQEMIAVLEKNY